MTHIEVLKKCRKAFTDEMSFEDNPPALEAVEAIDSLPTEIGKTSDGYHTFDELYEHRIELWIALCRVCRHRDWAHPWRSKVHSDGSKMDGWFVLGMWFAPGSQISYHLPNSRWEECSFADTIERAPEFDGHTSADVLERLRSL